MNDKELVFATLVTSKECVVKARGTRETDRGKKRVRCRPRADLMMLSLRSRNWQKRRQGQIKSETIDTR